MHWLEEEKIHICNVYGSNQSAKKPCVNPRMQLKPMKIINEQAKRYWVMKQLKQHLFPGNDRKDFLIFKNSFKIIFQCIVLFSLRLSAS